MLRHPLYWLLLVLLRKLGARRLVVACADAAGRQRGKPAAQRPASLTSA